MTEALRSVYADIGLTADTSALDKADAAIDAVTAKLQRLVSGSGFSGSGIFEKLHTFVSRGGQVTADVMKAIGVEQDVQAGVGQRVLELHKASADEIEKQNALLQYQQSALGQVADAEKRRLAFQKERLDHEQGQRERATPAGQARAQDRLRMGAETARSDRAERRAWDASPAGQEAAALERIEAAADAARKPVTGLMDLLGRFQVRASTAIGQKLPMAFQRLSARIGIAKGDFATMGQVAAGATLGVLAVLHRGITSLFEFGSAFAATSEQLRETAREARVTSSELQALQYAGTVSGVGADRMTRSVTALGQRLRDANSHLAGSGSTVYLLRRLGISARDSSGQVRPTIDVLSDLSVAMEHVSSPRRRIRIAEALGLDRRTLDVLHTGAGGIQELMARTEALGGGVTPEATEAARRFTIAQENLKLATTSLKSAFFTQLAPALEWIVQKGALLFGWVSRMTRGSHYFQVALIALGVVGAAAGLAIVAAWLPVVAPFLAAAAGALALSLILDDLWGLIEGNNSAIGYLLEEMLGIEDATALVDDFREGWDFVAFAVDLVVTKIRELFRFSASGLRFMAEIQRNTVNGVARGLGLGDVFTEREGGQREEGPAPDPDAAGRARRALPRQSRVERTAERAKARSERAKAARPAPAPASTQVGLDGRVIGQTPAVARPTTVTHQHRHEGSRYSFQITGINAREIGTHVEATVRRLQQEQRDGAHPTETEG
jgi:hypothetical protein